MSVQTIGVVGAATMGTGIAQVATATGFKATLVDVNEEALSKAVERIGSGFARLLAKGQMIPEAKQGSHRSPCDGDGLRRPRIGREIVRQQFLILHLGEERAIEALPKPAASADDRRLVLESLHRIRGLRQPEFTEEQQRRFSRLEKLLAPPAARTARRESIAAMK